MATLDTDELNKVKAVFAELGIETEELTTSEDLKVWLQSHAKEEQPVKQETEEQPAKNETPEQPVKKEKVEQEQPQDKKAGDRRPRISNFWGTTTQKDATSFDVWKYEICCYLEDSQYSEESILEAIRRSIKGDAAKVLMRMGPKASVVNILDKLEGLYGTVATEGTLLTEFYAAQQNENEDVTAWSCRLEDTIQKVHERRLISGATMREMLRSKLWSGLRNEALRNATRYKYDLIKDFDELVIEIRSVEHELGADKKKVKAHSLQKATGKADEKDGNILKDISDRLEKMEKKMEDMKTQNLQDSQERTGYRNQRGSSRGRYHRGRGRGRGQWRDQQWRESRPHRDETGPHDDEKAGVDNEEEDVVCYRCGQIGHIALGCRVRIDHLKHLNRESPLPGGGQ
jgi:hypothetical protein